MVELGRVWRVQERWQSQELMQPHREMKPPEAKISRERIEDGGWSCNREIGGGGSP
jgi:hypothetical protein